MLRARAGAPLNSAWGRAACVTQVKPGSGEIFVHGAKPFQERRGCEGPDHPGVYRVSISQAGNARDGYRAGLWTLIPWLFDKTYLGADREAIEARM
jgi:hypothetical protein